MPLTMSSRKDWTVDTEDSPIELIILGHRFEVAAIRGPKGGVWWALCDESGNRDGVDVSPLGSALPAGLTVNGEEYEFQPVPNSGDTPGFKPLQKTRQLRSETHLGSHRINIHCRITVKRNKLWHLWFQAQRVGGKGTAPPPSTTDPPTAQGLTITVHEVNPEQH